jgi:magnesium-transporting ATPase (P-type)
MLRRYYIDKEWILTTARKVYRYSAGASVIGMFGLVWIWTKGVPSIVAPFLSTLLLLFALATAITAVAMEYVLFAFDTSSVWKKAIFFFLLMLPPLGPALYCFTVYSRQQSKAMKASEATRSSSSFTASTSN